MKQDELKEFLEVFYQNNPDLKGRIMLDAIETLEVLSLTHKDQLTRAVESGLIAKLDVSMSERPRYVYSLPDIIKIAIRNKEEGKNTLLFTRGAKART